MPIFKYEAIDTLGNRIVDSTEAVNKEELLLNLQVKGVILIKWLDNDHKTWDFFKSSKKISKKNLLQVTNDLAHLMKSDLPIDRSLNIIANSTSNKSIKEVSQYLQKSIQGGSSLSEAMASRPDDFDNLYVNMVRVGEVGGILAHIMKRLGELLDSTEQIKSFIISTSIYPAILVIVGFLSILVIMGFVVPSFAKVFEDLGQQIPLSTQVLMFLSDFLRAWWWLIIALFFVIFISSSRYIKTPLGRQKLDEILIKIPYLGTLIIEIQVSRFSRTLGTLVQSGVPLLKALSIVKDIVGNSVLKEAIEYIYQQVKEGKRISSLMQGRQIFPSMVVQMVALGEETGKIGEMLSFAADDLDNKIQVKIKTFLSMLEPLAILVMGLFIGGIVVSMLSTIFGINDIDF